MEIVIVVAIQRIDVNNCLTAVCLEDYRFITDTKIKERKEKKHTSLHNLQLEFLVWF